MSDREHRMTAEERVAELEAELHRAKAEVADASERIAIADKTADRIAGEKADMEKKLDSYKGIIEKMQEAYERQAKEAVEPSWSFTPDEGRKSKPESSTHLDSVKWTIEFMGDRLIIRGRGQ